MLTKEEFDTIEVGDEVDTAIPLLPALCEDAIILVPTQKGDTTIGFTMTYCGVTLGTATCTAGETDMKWVVK